MLAVVLLIAIAAISGGSYEAISRDSAIRSYPPPGQMVDIGGRRIQMDCRGEGGPVVVFESGLGTDGSLSWAKVQGAVSLETRSCSYSRAGILWSDVSHLPQDGERVAQDLHAALGKAGEKPPFILVGHSMGGPYSMIFTKRYGSEVAGLILVDASHPDQLARFRETFGTDFEDLGMTSMRLSDAFTWTGAMRLMNAVDSAKSEADRISAAFAPQSYHASLKEIVAVPSTLMQAGQLRDLGCRPLYVLTAMRPLTPESVSKMGLTPVQGRQFKQVWKALQDDEANWSSNSRHEIVPDSGHYIQEQRPDLVIAAIHWVVDQVRNSSPTGTRH